MSSRTSNPGLRKRRPQSDQDWYDVLDELNRNNLATITIQDEGGIQRGFRANFATGALEVRKGKGWHKFSTRARIERVNTQIVRSGGITTTVIEGESDHNLLNNLQGGLWPNELYHLSAADYNALVGLSASRLVATNASGALASVADLSAWVAGTSNRVTVANDGDGTITLSAPQDIHTAASPTFAGMTLTAFSGYVKATAGVLSAGAIVVGDLPAHDILSASHGDTLADTVVRGDVLYGNATPKWARLAFPASPTGKLIQATATDVGWSTYPLTIGAASSINQDVSTIGSPTHANLTLSGAGAAHSIEIGDASSSQYAYIDLKGDTTYTDYGLRIIRGNAGANATSQLVHRGTGVFSLIAQDAGAIVLGTSNTTRLTLGSAGALTGAAALAVDLGDSASLEIPNAASPTVDAEGEVAWDTDDDKLLIYDGTAAICLAAKTKSRSFTILSPTSAHDCPIWQTPRAITITGIRAICLAGTNVIGCLDEYGTNGTTLVAAVDGGWTITTSEFNDTSFTNAGIAAGGWLRWRTTSVSGAVTSVSLTFEYTEA